MAAISGVKRRNAWRRAIRDVGVLFVAFGLCNFAYTIFRGIFDKPLQVLQALFLAIFLTVAGLLAINYAIETEEKEGGEETDTDTDDQTADERTQTENEGGEAESRDSVGKRIQNAIYDTLADLKRHCLAMKIRQALAHLAHRAALPRRNPRPRL
jgi:hypothetical protein